MMYVPIKINASDYIAVQKLIQTNGGNRMSAECGEQDRSSLLIDRHFTALFGVLSSELQFKLPSESEYGCLI